jgi:RNA polymerase sigma-70 factor, ECF subfamily
MINVCRDRGRAKSRTPDTVNIEDVEEFSLYRRIADEDPFPYSDTLHLDFLQRFGKEDVKEILLSLPDLYRIPLVLVHMYGYSTKEVAKSMDVPLGTVLARLHRARKLFERRMWDYAGANDLLKESVK